MPFRSGFLILATALIVSALSTWAQSEDIKATQLKGTRFITVMNGNTLSATNEDGVSYKAYFVKGGIARYEDESGLDDNGKWLFNEDGDICIVWDKIDPGKAHCAKVYVLGDNLIWKGDSMTGNGKLLGTVK